MGLVYNHRQYVVNYNPADMNEIDLIADEMILDEINGQYYEPGDTVMTLTCTRNLPKGEKAEKVNELNRAAVKHIKKLAEVTLSQGVMDDAELEKAIHTEVSEDGRGIDRRKSAVKRIKTAIEESVPEVRKIMAPVELEPSSPVHQETGYRAGTNGYSDMSEEEMLEDDAALGGREILNDEI